MRIRIAVPDENISAEVIDPVLEAVTRLNSHMIDSGQTPTSHELLDKGAVWRPENMGDEHFDHGATIAERGWGDCDDWAPLHAATLRNSGEDPGAVARVVKSGPNTWHALVQRSDGSIEDPSIAAGMKSDRPSNINGEEPYELVGDEVPNVWVCDPHDGRIYQGALAPTVGPLSIHCGPGISVRGCHVVGHGPLYEARIDLPIVGDVVAVRHRSRRHKPHRGRTAYIHGVVPRAISVTHVSPYRSHALHGALCGALMCGDASGMTADIDRYKLLALTWAQQGKTPGQIHDMLVTQMHADMLAKSKASGMHPQDHVNELLAQTYPPSPNVSGFFSGLAHIASSVVHDVSSVAKAIVPKGVLADISKGLGAIGPWAGDILHGVEAAVSVIPGLGTAISDVVAAGETAFESVSALLKGNPFEAAIRAAYNFATASIPGASALRPLLDPVVSGLIALTVKHEPVDSAVLDGLLSKVPDDPKIGHLSPRSVAASLAHLIVGHLGVRHQKNSPPPMSRPAAPPRPANKAIVVTPAPALSPAAPPPAAAPVTVSPAPIVKPIGPAHAAHRARDLAIIDVVAQPV
jgi:hypothetical protein